MKKRLICIISSLIIIALIAICIIIIGNYNSDNYNMIFPNTIEVVAGDKVFIANKRYELWQYPSKNDEISKINSTPMITDKMVQQIISFLGPKELINVKGNNLTVNFENLKDCKLEEIRYVSCAIYDDNKVVLLNEFEIVNNQITIDIGELQTDKNYYCEVMLVYPYNSIIKYDFKFIIQ